MIKKSLKVIKDVARRLLSSFRRFPEPLALAFLTVVILILMNHLSREDVFLFRLVMVLALGIPLTLCMRMFWERSSVQKIVAAMAYIAVPVILILYYHFLLPDMEMVPLTRYLAITLFLYLLFIVIPYWGRKDGFEFYVIRLTIGFFVTYFYSVVLFAGLAAILFTINTLFAADIPNEVYLDLWLIVAGIFAPAYFLAGFPAYGEDNKNEEYPKFLQGLLLYIVMPLLSVYTAILYIYFLKIIITRFWPAGIVSHLVLWYSLVSTVVIFFSYLLKEKNTRARLFIAYFPKLILPLMIMMFAAMGIRISAYGITENRYFVLIGGLWTTGCMLYYALKRDAMNIKIVLSLALVAVFAVSGPWSAYSVSKYSQNMQMKKLLLRNNMLVDGEIVPSAEIPQSDKVSISSIVQYFERNHNLNELHVLPQDFSMSDMEETFGFDFALSSTQTAYFRHHPEETFGLLDVGDYDYFIPSFAEFQEEGTLINKDSLSIAYEAETLKISKDGQLLYTKDIAEAALDIHNANIGKDSLKNEEMIFVDETEHLKIMVIFQSIYGTENGEPSIDWLDFAVLLKIY